MKQEIESYVESLMDKAREEREKASPPRNLKYDIVYGDSYASALQSLRNKCSDSNSAQPVLILEDGRKVIRPLTLRETLQACVDDFNTQLNKYGSLRSLEDRLKLFNRNLKTCTGAYRAGSSSIKVVPCSRDLVMLSRDNSRICLGFPDNLEGDSIRISYRNTESVWQTREEVLEDRCWITAVEEDRKLLDEFSKIVFMQLKQRYNSKRAMAFSISEKKLGLSPLMIYDLKEISRASIYTDPSLNARANFIYVSKE